MNDVIALKQYEGEYNILLICNIELEIIRTIELFVCYSSSIYWLPYHVFLPLLSIE